MVNRLADSSTYAERFVLYFTYTLKKMFEYRGWIDNSVFEPKVSSLRRQMRS